MEGIVPRPGTWERRVCGTRSASTLKTSVLVLRCVESNDKRTSGLTRSGTGAEGTIEKRDVPWLLDRRIQLALASGIPTQQSTGGACRQALPGRQHLGPKRLMNRSPISWRQVASVMQSGGQPLVRCASPWAEGEAFVRPIAFFDGGNFSPRRKELAR